MSCVSASRVVSVLADLTSSGSSDYINDGVYGAFNCIMFDHQIVHPYPLTISHSLESAIPRLPGPPPPNVALDRKSVV